MSFGVGTLLLPLIVRFLSPAELGLWYVFNGLGGLVGNLTNLGFGQSIYRNAGYLLAGAPEVLAEGIAKGTASRSPNWSGLSTLYRAGGIVFVGIASAALLLLGVFGTPFVLQNLTQLPDSSVALAGWAAYLAGLGFALYSNFFLSYLEGVGGIAESSRLQSIIRGLSVLTTAGLLLAGTGLLGMGLAYLASNVFLVTWLRAALIQRIRPAMNVPIDRASQIQMVRILWPNTLRAGLTNVGSFLIMNSGALVCSQFLGLATAASYGLTLQVLRICSNLSTAWIGTVAPRLNALRAAGDLPALRGLFAQRLVLMVLTFVVFAGLALGAGPLALQIIGSRSSLLPQSAMALFVLIITLELVHQQFSFLILTENSVPFAPAAITSGIAMVVIAGLLANSTPLGVWSVILAQGGVQAAFNNWYWVLRGFATLQMPVGDFLRLLLQSTVRNRRAAVELVGR